MAGFIVNRMRGDISLFADGMTEIAKHTGWPSLGLVPFFEGAQAGYRRKTLMILSSGEPRE